MEHIFGINEFFDGSTQFIESVGLWQWCLTTDGETFDARGYSETRAKPLSPRQREIAETLGPTLAKRGLLLVGLDIIGDWLTEVNVTSPTCFREIQDQSGFDVAGTFVAALEARIA